MPSPALRFKRGGYSTLPGLQLGEPGFTTDKYDLYIGFDGNPLTNKFFGSSRNWIRETTVSGGGIKLHEASLNGNSGIILRAPNSIDANQSYILPVNPVEGYYLRTNSSGELTWSNSYSNIVTDEIVAGIATFTESVSISSTITSYNSSTGALVVVGGVGIGSNLNVGNNLLVSGISTFVGSVTFQGGTINLGDSNTDNINVIGEFVSNLIPNDDGVYDIGTVLQRWRNTYFLGIGTFGNGATLNSIQAGVNSTNTIDTDTGILVLSSADGVVITDANHSILGNLYVNGNFDITGDINVEGATIDNVQIGLTSSNTIDTYDGDLILSAYDKVIIDNDLLITGVSTFVGVIDANGGAYIDNIQVGINSDNTIDTQTGKLILDSQEGQVIIDDHLYVSGVSTFASVNINETSTFNNTVSIADTTQSTDKDTGALVIEGGVGIEKNLNVGGDLTVTGVSTFVGSITFQGGTITIGDSNTDDIVVSGEFRSNLIPTDNASYDIGSDSKKWRNANFSGVGTFDSGTIINNVEIGISSETTVTTTSGNLVLTSPSNNVIIDSELTVLETTSFIGTVNVNQGINVSDIQLGIGSGTEITTINGTLTLNSQEGTVVIDDQLNVTGVSTFAGVIDANGGAYVDNIQIGISNNNEIDTSIGTLTLDSAAGTVIVDDQLSVTGVSTFTGVIDANGGAYVDNVQIGISGDNEIDTTTGDLTLDSAGGTIIIDDQLSVTGVSTFTGVIDANGGAYVDNIQIGISGDNEIDTTSGDLTLDSSSGTVIIDDQLSVTGVSTFTGVVDANGGAYIDNVQIGISGDNEIDTTSGNLTLDSAGGTITIDDQLSVTGVSTFSDGINVTGSESTFSSLTVSDLTDNRIVLAGLAGSLSDDANLTFDGTTFNVTGHTEIDTLNATGISTFTDYVRISSGAGSTDKDTGALVVEGGVGIEENLNVGKDLYVVGNVQVSGASTFVGSITFQGGTITLGDSNTDDIVVSGEFKSNLIPTDDASYDIGSGEKRWRNASFSGVGTFNQGSVIDNIQIGIASSSEIDTTFGDLTLDSAKGTVIVDDQLNVTGVSTFSGVIDANGGAYIDNVQIGISADNEIDTTTGDLILDSQGGTIIIDDQLNVTGVSTFAGVIDANGGAYIDNVQIGISSNNTIDTTNGDLILDSNSGNIIIDDQLTVLGIATLNNGLQVNGEAIFNSATVSDLTDNRIVLAGPSGSLEDDANLTFNGTTFNVTGHTEIDTLNATGISTFTNLVRLNDNTQSNNKDTGSLVVEGGVGVEKNLNVGGDIYVSGISTFINNINLNGQIISNIIPALDDAYNIGTASNRWKNADFSGVGTFATGVVADNIEIGIQASNKINSTNGTLILDSAEGTVVIDDQLSVIGISTFSNDVDINQQINVDGHSQLNSTLSVSGVSTFSDTIDANGGAYIDNIQIGISGNNIIDTSSGNLTLDSQGGLTVLNDDVVVSGNLIVNGQTTFVESQNVYVGDTLVSLGSTDDVPPETISTKDLGLALYSNITGTGQTGASFYDVSSNEYVLAESVSGISTGVLSVEKYLSLRTKNVYATGGSINVENDIEVVQSISGITTLKNIDSLDSTTETTIENAIDTLPNLTSIQSQTITLNGSLNVGSASSINQDVSTYASPTFNQVNVSTGLTATNIQLGISSSTTINTTSDHLVLDSYEGTVIVDDQFIVTGVSTFNNTIDANGGAYIDAIRIGIADDYTIDTTIGNLTLDSNGGTVFVNDKLTVSDFATFDGTIDANAGAYIDNIQIGISENNTIDTSSGNLILDSAAGTIVVNDKLTVSGVSTFNSLLHGTAGSIIDNIQIGISSDNEIDTKSGNLILDSFAGQTIIDDRLYVAGISTFYSGIGVTGGESIFSSATVSDLTDNRIVLAGPLGSLEDDANLTFNGTTFNVTGHTEIDTLNATGISTFTNLTRIIDATQSTDKDTGSLVVEGGVGIEKNLNVGGDLHITGVSTFVGSVTFQGGTINLGDSSTDDIVVSGEFKSNLIPTDDASYDIGSSSKRWRNTSFSGIGTFNEGAVIDNVQIGIGSSSEIDTSNGNLTLDSAAGTVIIDDQLSVTGVSTFTGVIDANGGAYIDNVQIGISGDNEIDTTSGDLTLDSAGGTIIIDDQLSVIGVSTFTGVIDANSGAYIDNVQIGISSDNTIDTVTGPLILDSNEGTIIVDGDLTITGITTFNSATSLKNIQIGVADDNTIDTSIGTLTLDSFAGTVIVDDQLSVTGVSTFTGVIDANGGAYVDNVQIGISGNNEIDTTSGDLTLDSAGGTIIIDDRLDVSGISTFNAGINVIGGESTFSSATVSDLTDNRIVLAGPAGSLEDDANLTFNGTTFNVTGHTEIDTLNATGISTFTNYVRISSGAGSTDKDTGALIVEGGVGIEKNLNVGGDTYVSGISTFEGSVTFKGGTVNLGDSFTDNIVVSGEFGSALIPSLDGSFDIGTGPKRWRHASFSGVGTFNEGLVVDYINIGINSANQINSTFGPLILDSAIGTIQINDNIIISGVSTFQGNAYFGDNDTINLGDNNDFQIYHDGTDNIIGVDTGKLKLYVNDGLEIRNTFGNEALAIFNSNGSAELYYDDSRKFETLGIGATVIGALYSNQLRVDTGSLISGLSTFVGSGTSEYTVKVQGGINGDVFGIGTSQPGSGIRNDSMNNTLDAYRPYSVTASRVRISIASSINGSMIEDDALVINEDGTVSIASSLTVGTISNFNGPVNTFNGIVNINQGVLVNSGYALTASTVDINGGNIDATVIGSASSTNAYFTDVTSVNIKSGIITSNDYLVGATTVFTTQNNLVTLAGIQTIDSVTKQTFETILEQAPNDFDSLYISGITTLGTTSSDTVTVNGNATFNGTLTGTISTSIQVKTQDVSSGVGTYFLTFVDSNNASATPETVYTDTDISYHPESGSLNVPILNVNTINSSSGNAFIEVGTGNVTVNSNLTVSGNLSIGGTVTQVNVETLNIEDRIINVGLGSTSPTDSTWDLGILFNYFKSSQTKRSGIFWDDSAGRIGIASHVPDITDEFGTVSSAPGINQSTVVWAPIEIGALWVNDCAGQSQVISCSSGERQLENITIDCGSY